MPGRHSHILLTRGTALSAPLAPLTATQSASQRVERKSASRGSRRCITDAVAHVPRRSCSGSGSGPAASRSPRSPHTSAGARAALSGAAAPGTAHPALCRPLLRTLTLPAVARRWRTEAHPAPWPLQGRRPACRADAAPARAQPAPGITAGSASRASGLPFVALRRSASPLTAAPAGPWITGHAAGPCQPVGRSQVAGLHARPPLLSDRSRPAPKPTAAVP